MLLTLNVARAIGHSAVDESAVDSFILCAAALLTRGALNGGRGSKSDSKLQFPVLAAIK